MGTNFKPPSSALDGLRERTRPAHERLEQALDLLGDHLTPERYRALLERFYGLYAPLERRLQEAAPWSQLGYDFDDRRKVPLLERDLTQLGRSATDLAQLPRPLALPRIEGLATALGAMYVLEGSTLGGQLLSRHFAGRLGITADTGCAFFTSYGPEVGKRWLAFRTFLEAHVPAEPEPTLRAAVETFDSLHQWLLA